MASHTLPGQDYIRNGAYIMPQPLSRRSFVQGAAALAVAPIVARMAPAPEPEAVQEDADRMTVITALLLEIERDYPDLMPEILAFTEAMVRGDDPAMFRALLQTGAELPEIAAKYA
jgi:hypothetical protein